MRFAAVVVLVACVCALAQSQESVQSVCVGASSSTCCSVCKTTISDTKNGDCNSVSGKYAMENYISGVPGVSINHAKIVSFVTELCEVTKKYSNVLSFFTPDEVCSRINACPSSFRRRRGTDSASQEADAEHLRTLAQDLNLTPADFEFILTLHSAVLSQRGAPVAVYADGSKGYCSADSQTGLYTCLESNDDIQLARHASQVSLGASASSSSDSGTKTAIIVVGVVLGTLLVFSLAILGLMWSRQSRVIGHAVQPIATDGLGERLL